MTHYCWSERVGPGFFHSYEVELLYEKTTPYQHMRIFHTPLWGRVLVLDGVVQLTEGDEHIYHEMMAHVPLMGRRRPAESVLIVGGADGGLLREVLTHDSVKRVVHVELDEAVLNACRKYLPDLCDGWDDPRVQLVIGDGATYIREAARRGETFDTILLDSTDPFGPSIVLFDKPFHEHLCACLTDDGVAVRQAGLPLTMPDVTSFVLVTFRNVLPGVWTYRAPIPTYGDEMAFVVGSKDGSPIHEPRQKRKGRFYNPACHRAAFALPTWWQDLIDNCEGDRKMPVMVIVP